MNKTDRKKIFRLFHAASRFESRLSKSENKLQHGHFFRNYHWYWQVGPVCLSIMVLVVQKNFDTQIDMYLKFGGLLFLLFSYVATICYPLILAWVYRRSLVPLIKDSFGQIIQNASNAAVVDSRVLARLKSWPIEHLELLHLELKAEKNFFTKRVALVIGAVEKIGLIPGLLAVSINLVKPDIEASTWLLALAYGAIALYLLAVPAHFQIMKLDRFVEVSGLAIVRKRKKE